MRGVMNEQNPKYLNTGITGQIAHCKTRVLPLLNGVLVFH